MTPSNSKLRERPLLAAAAVIVLATIVVFFQVPHLNELRDPTPHFPANLLWKQRVIFGGFFAAALFAAHPGIAWLRRIRRPDLVAYSAVALSAIFIAGFLWHFGNRQFGAWDYAVIIDSGWRQLLGQRPYTDFLTPHAFGFNLGAYLAFYLFGVGWKSLTGFTVLFSLITFVWSFLLLLRLRINPLAAWFVAFALQSVTFLSTCFWWYNNSTDILACLFLLSLYICATEQRYNPWPWMSYAVSLGLLGLFKPNIAGLLLGCGCVALLVAAPRPKWGMLLWTASGCAFSLLLLLVRGISIRDMLTNFHAAAIERGFSLTGLAGIRMRQRLLILLVVFLTASPLVRLIRPLRDAARSHAWRRIAFMLMLVLPLPTTIYADCVHREYKEMELAVTIAAVATLVFSQRLSNRWGRDLFIAMLTALSTTAMYYGAVRLRVEGIGDDAFFAYADNHTPVGDPFFVPLTASPRLATVQSEVHRAVLTSSLPVFFGPRLEYEYAVLKEPSPLNLAVDYEPGTMFARSATPHILDIWKGHHFGTLIFLSDDRTYYPPQFLAEIDHDYIRVPGYSDIQVYKLR